MVFVLRFGGEYDQRFVNVKFYPVCIVIVSIHFLGIVEDLNKLGCQIKEVDEFEVGDVLEEEDKEDEDL